MEPAGSTQIKYSYGEFSKAQYDIRYYGRYSCYRLERLYSLRTPRHHEQFAKACSDYRHMVAYLDVDNYIVQNNIQLEDLFQSGFDNLNPFYGLVLHSSCDEILTYLRVSQYKFPQQKYVQHILEVLVCTGVPMVVEDYPELLSAYNQYNLPQSYDSYAIIPKGAFKIQTNQIVHQNYHDYMVKYKIFYRQKMLPVKLLVVTCDTDTQEQYDYCQICLECKQQNISRETYFGGASTYYYYNFKPNVAVVYCKNDDLKLCQECDSMLHKGVLSRHSRTELKNQFRLLKCPLHPDEPLSYYDHVNSKFYCLKCLSGYSINQINQNTQNIVYLETLYNDYLANKEQNLDVSKQLNIISGYQNSIYSMLQSINQFSYNAEHTLIKYFKQLINQLQINTQLFIQQLLSQDSIISCHYTSLFQQAYFMEGYATRLSINEQMQYYYQFNKSKALINADLVNDQLFIQQFIIGLYSQIKSFTESYCQVPLAHLNQIQYYFARYYSSRLYGMYAKVARSELVELESSQDVMQYLIYKQLLEEKVNAGVRDYQGIGEFNEYMTMKIFNQVSQNDRIFAFNLQDYPIYQAMQEEAIKKYYYEAQQRLEEQQKREEEEKRRQQEESLYATYQPLLYTQNPIYLTEDYYGQMQASVFKGTLHQTARLDPNSYLDQLFDGSSYYQVISNAVVGTQQDFNYVGTVASVNYLFDSASRTVQRRQEMWRDRTLEYYSYPPQEYVTEPPKLQHGDAPTSTIFNGGYSAEAAPYEGTLMAENLALSTRREYRQPAEPPTQPAAARDQAQTIEQSFYQLEYIYRLRKKNVQLPSTPFQSSNIDSERAKMVYLQSLHNLAKDRGFPRLKLLEPYLRFDKRRGTKFAAILAICYGMPCAFIISMSFDGEYKQLALSTSYNLQEGTTSSRFNFLCDLSSGEFVYGQELILDRKNWRYGDILFIYKDFAGIDYYGRNWTVNSIEVYCYEW